MAREYFRIDDFHNCLTLLLPAASLYRREQVTPLLSLCLSYLRTCALRNHDLMQYCLFSAELSIVPSLPSTERTRGSEPAKRGTGDKKIRGEGEDNVKKSRGGMSKSESASQLSGEEVEGVGAEGEEGGSRRGGEVSGVQGARQQVKCGPCPTSWPQCL